MALSQLLPMLTLLNARCSIGAQALLTFLGGGVFDNPQHWIEGAIARACARLHAVGLQVVICHHGRVDQAIVERLDAAIRELRAGGGAASSP